ncbi:MAG: hypothetical protein SGBAC_009388 [Bacillariaceae sp.]
MKETEQQAMTRAKRMVEGRNANDNEGDPTSNDQTQSDGEELKGKDDQKEDLTLPNHHYFFCVLDGHGGEFTANYSRDHLLPILLQQDAFQEYERIWRAATLDVSTIECKTASDDEIALSASSKPGSKKDEATCHPEDKEDNNVSQQSKIPEPPKTIANRNEEQKDRNLGVESQLLQRALEDAFVELDLLLLQEMVRQEMFDPLFSTEDKQKELAAFKLMSGTTAVAVLVTPDLIICANLGDSRASLMVSSSPKRKKRRIQEDITATFGIEISADDIKSFDEEDCWSIVALSEDHKPSLPKEKARIEAANGKVTSKGRVEEEGKPEGGLTVARALGDFDFKGGYPLELSNCKEPSAITKLRDRRERRRMQARFEEAKSSGGDEKVHGEKGEDLDWEKQRAIAQQLRVSCFPEVIVHPRGSPKEEGNGIGRQVDGGQNGQEKVLLLACDGIWDVMTTKYCHNFVQELLKKGETNMGLIAEKILDKCLEKDSKDNMTVMVVHFSDTNKFAPVGAGNGMD